MIRVTTTDDIRQIQIVRNSVKKNVEQSKPFARVREAAAELLLAAVTNKK